MEVKILVSLYPWCGFLLLDDVVSMATIGAGVVAKGRGKNIEESKVMS